MTVAPRNRVVDRVACFKHRPAIAAIVCLVGSLVGACGGSPSRASPNRGLAGRPQSGTVRLSAGRASGKFEITALPPPTHSWDVRVTSPRTADVSVDALTWYGVRLHVIYSSRGDAGCHAVGALSSCFARFPFLEAQRAGRWTVIVAKRSGPPATVNVTITFEA